MFILPDLPYAYDALAPHISAQTLRLHHGKHHAGYVKKTNALVAEQGLDAGALEGVIAHARGKDQELFNQAAQAWNHAFFWQAMTPRGGRAPKSGPLADAVARDFSGIEALRSLWRARGESHFASGWLWLHADANGKLSLFEGHDAENPLDRAGAPLLVCDLWEHAYYLDHQNERGAFLDAMFDHLIDWDFAASQFAAAQGKAAPWRYPAPRRAAA